MLTADPDLPRSDASSDVFNESGDRPDRLDRLFVDDLWGFGDRPSVITGDRVLTYVQLMGRVEQRAEQFGSIRRLVMLIGSNDQEFVISYLAALRAGHPVWLLPDGNEQHLRSLVKIYEPDLIVTTGDGEVKIDERRCGTMHDLHPELAVLMSTSGSTGSNKVVRLSHGNIQSNAGAIAQFLTITEDDRAMTSLPMHYCYGLSVVNSHLLSGAALIVTSDSVVDPCFWHAVRRHRVSNFAGVPQTFDLLDQIGFESMEAPSLRFITQAGGRLTPEKVRRYAELGLARGWELYVMYGQTEATARMAYLPPALAAEHPRTVGIPIPGGSIELRASPDETRPGVGEIVYTGPNVMLGYAKAPSDLRLGRTIDELVTGDLGRFNDVGLLEVVGRRSRFIKMFGIRVDLQEVERILQRSGTEAVCAGEDGRLVVAVTTAGQDDLIRSLLASELRLPRRSIHVHNYEQIPLLPNGKPDYVTIGHTPPRSPHAGHRSGWPVLRRHAQPQSVRAIFDDVMDRHDLVDQHTFVDMGGDSLSYVEMSIRLEETLGFVPTDWHITPLAELAELQPRRTRLTRVETNVVLRATAIIMIVGTHMRAFYAPGGAHVLLAISGFNFARFQLSARGARERLRSTLGTMGRVALPASLWIGAQMLVAGGYSVGALFLLNNYWGSRLHRDGRWHFWYIEALVQILLVVTFLLVIPAIARLERKAPYCFVIALLGASLLFRFRLLEPGDSYNYIYRSHTILWFFLIGWAAQRSRTIPQRLLLSGVVLTAVPGFFLYQQRVLTVIIGLLALVWLSSLTMPRPFNRLVGIVAAASMCIFITHQQVWPPLDRNFVSEIALAMTVGVGIMVWLASERLTSFIRHIRRPT